MIEGETPIDMLAEVAGATTAECRARGAAWSLARLLERRLPIQSMIVVMRASGNGLAYAKGLVQSATEPRVRALGEAIDRRDEDAAVAVLDAWMPRDHADNERCARGLVRTFGPG